MASFSVNDTVRVVVYASAGDQLGENVYFYQIVAVSGDGPTVGKFGLDYSTRVQAAYKNLMSESATFNGVTVQNLSAAPRLAPVGVTADAGPGLADPGLAARQTCGLIRKRSPLGSAHARGRAYIPFPSSVESDTDGTPIGDYVDRLDALATLLVANATLGAGGNTCVIAPVLVDRPIILVTAITVMYGVKKWATQVRRGSFGRPNPITP